MGKTTAAVKYVFAALAIACICAVVAITPAYAYYYVNNDAHVEAPSTGAIEVVCTVDETAVGGSVYTGIIFVPSGSTAGACLDELLVGPRAHNNVEAIHDYSVVTLGEYLNGKSYTCSVYAAGSQTPGTQTSYDTASLGGEDVSINRFDSVVFTVQ